MPLLINDITLFYKHHQDDYASAGWVGLAYNVILSPFLRIRLPVPEIPSDLLCPVLLSGPERIGTRGMKRSNGGRKYSATGDMDIFRAVLIIRD